MAEAPTVEPWMVTCGARILTEVFGWPEKLNDEEMEQIAHILAQHAPFVQAAVEEEREACAKLVDDWATNYPTDVFPDPPKREHGQSVDACSARALRAVLPIVAHYIRARGSAKKEGAESE